MESHCASVAAILCSSSHKHCCALATTRKRCDSPIWLTTDAALLQQGTWTAGGRGRGEAAKALVTREGKQGRPQQRGGTQRCISPLPFRRDGYTTTAGAAEEKKRAGASSRRAKRRKGKKSTRTRAHASSPFVVLLPLRVAAGLSADAVCVCVRVRVLQSSPAFSCLS